MGLAVREGSRESVSGSSDTLISESSRLCGTLFPGQRVEIQIGKYDYPEGELGKKNNRQKTMVGITNIKTQPVYDGYPYPDRQINRSEDLKDTPTPSSTLQVFVAYMKTGKLGKKDCWD